MSKPFKLRAALFGHSLDVRSVTVNSNNDILSGSRDKTAKLWVGNSFNSQFSEAMTYKDQKNFVACVLYLDSSTEYPTGLVVTGGNDHTILVYKPHEPFATLTLKEHSNVVCKLSKGVLPNSFLSGSWDSTAKLWFLSKAQSANTYSGHTAAVWSVIQLQNGKVVTASADKTIGIFSQDGFRINTIQGHTDCIRDLADFPELNNFISVSNDATIRVWSYTGNNLDTYYGHTNYIYSIARNIAGGNNCFVTTDEDRTVRYWKDGVNTEMFHLPAQSVWTVSCFNNGDIVTGSSDGIVRVFTQDESRFANEESIKMFEESVAALTKQATQEIGGYKVSDLPGTEALYEPGKRAGQMKMIREPGGVVAYTWVEEGESSHWEKVGEVLGSADPDAGSKTTYEGKAYDFVFSVDVEDGKPPLKLPYNTGDDPYVAAHRFLEKNMLPPAYLDQVVEFILKNSSAPKEQQPTNSTFVDPYTGASRYTPTATSTPASTAGSNSDPFTGGSSYSSSHGQTNITVSNNTNYFPQHVYRTFDQGDPNLILKKLKEFNNNAEDHSVSEEYLDNLIRLCTESTNDIECFATLVHLLNWKDDIVFPVLDVLRLAAKQEDNNKKICSNENEFIIEKLIYYSSDQCKVVNCTLVAFRTLCNLFAHPAGQQTMFTYRVSFLENIASLTVSNKNVQIALATFLLNMTIMSIKREDEFGILLLCNVLPEVLMRMDDSEAQFRCLVAIGTLLSLKITTVSVKIKENTDFIKKIKMASNECTNDSDLKRQKCAAQVVQLINSL